MSVLKNWSLKMFVMQTSHKIIAFLVYSILLFGAGWSMRPVEKREEKIEITENLDLNKAKEVEIASEDKKESKSKKTNFRADGSVESVEEHFEISFAKYSEKVREAEELKRRLAIKQEIKIEKSQPRVLTSLVPSYNMNTEKWSGKEGSIQGNIFANAYFGVGYEQRDLPMDRKEDVIKFPFTMAW
jgi:hypothetical protein